MSQLFQRAQLDNELGPAPEGVLPPIEPPSNEPSRKSSNETKQTDKSATASTALKTQPPDFGTLSTKLVNSDRASTSKKIPGVTLENKLNPLSSKLIDMPLKSVKQSSDGAAGGTTSASRPSPSDSSSQRTGSSNSAPSHSDPSLSSMLAKKLAVSENPEESTNFSPVLTSSLPSLASILQGCSTTPPASTPAHTSPPEDSKRQQSDREPAAQKSQRQEKVKYTPNSHSLSHKHSSKHANDELSIFDQFDKKIFGGGEVDLDLQRKLLLGVDALGAANPMKESRGALSGGAGEKVVPAAPSEMERTIRAFPSVEFDLSSIKPPPMNSSVTHARNNDSSTSSSNTDGSSSSSQQGAASTSTTSSSAISSSASSPSSSSSDKPKSKRGGRRPGSGRKPKNSASSSSVRRERAASSGATTKKSSAPNSEVSTPRDSHNDVPSASSSSSVTSSPAARSGRGSRGGRGRGSRGGRLRGSGRGRGGKGRGGRPRGSGRGRGRGRGRRGGRRAKPLLPEKVTEAAIAEAVRSAAVSSYSSTASSSVTASVPSSAPDSSENGDIKKPKQRRSYTRRKPQPAAAPISPILVSTSPVDKSPLELERSSSPSLQASSSAVPPRSSHRPSRSSPIELDALSKLKLQDILKVVTQRQEAQASMTKSGKSSPDNDEMIRRLHKQVKEVKTRLERVSQQQRVSDTTDGSEEKLSRKRKDPGHLVHNTSQESKRARSSHSASPRSRSSSQSSQHTSAPRRPLSNQELSKVFQYQHALREKLFELLQNTNRPSSADKSKSKTGAPPTLKRAHTTDPMVAARAVARQKIDTPLSKDDPARRSSHHPPPHHRAHESRVSLAHDITKSSKSSRTGSPQPDTGLHQQQQQQRKQLQAAAAAAARVAAASRSSSSSSSRSKSDRGSNGGSSARGSASATTTTASASSSSAEQQRQHRQREELARRHQLLALHAQRQRELKQQHAIESQRVLNAAALAAAAQGEFGVFLCLRINYWWFALFRCVTTSSFLSFRCEFSTDVVSAPGCQRRCSHIGADANTNHRFVKGVCSIISLSPFRRSLVDSRG